jgi:hypothetical protein
MAAPHTKSAQALTDHDYDPHGTAS